MPYNESFWVTVGTAAPVIALASVVTISDLLKSADRFDWLAMAAGKTWPGRSKIYLGTLVGLQMLTIIVILTIQATALSSALQSLEHGRNEAIPDDYVTAMPLSIVLLVISAVLTVLIARTRRRVETMLKGGLQDTRAASQSALKPASQSAGIASKSDDPAPPRGGTALP
jgi:hypothetical protein